MKKKTWCVKMKKVLLTSSGTTIQRECEKQKPKIITKNRKIQQISYKKKNHQENDTTTTIKKRIRF